MLTFDSVRLRLEREQPLTFLEFNYMILQAYDFVELARRHGCKLQMGGSDQWGNIVNGVELGRRIDERELFGLTTPLITTASGAKMGKTRAGRRLAQRGARSRPTTTGSSGATPRTPMSAASCGCSPTCRWTRSRASKRWAAPRSTRRRRCWRPRRRRSPTAQAAAEAAAETARRTFEEGARGRGAADDRSCRAPSSSAAFPPSSCLHRAGLAASNGEARRLIKGGGARAQRRRRRGRDAAGRRSPISTPAA